MARLSANTAAVLDLAQRPQGCSQGEVARALGRSSSYCGGLLAGITRNHHLVVARVQGHHQRYFVRQEDADAWVLHAPPGPAPRHYRRTEAQRSFAGCLKDPTAPPHAHLLAHREPAPRFEPQPLPEPRPQGALWRGARTSEAASERWREAERPALEGPPLRAGSLDYRRCQRRGA